MKKELLIAVLGAVIGGIVLFFLVGECGPLNPCPREYGLVIFDPEYELNRPGEISTVHFSVFNKTPHLYSECATYWQPQIGVTFVTEKDERFSVRPGVAEKASISFPTQRVGEYESSLWVWCFEGEYDNRYLGGHPGESGKYIRTIVIR